MDGNNTAVAARVDPAKESMELRSEQTGKSKLER
jgi:hypothetical protein